MSVELDALTTLDESTGDAWSRKTRHRTNDATKTSTVWSRYIAGDHARIKKIQGGVKIRMRILLDYTRRFKRIGAYTTTIPSADESGTNLELPWSFGRTDYSYSDQDIMLNSAEASDDYVAQVFKDVLMQKRQVAMTDLGETMDTELIGTVPRFGTMESATVDTGEFRAPYPIHAFVNEYNAGLVEYADGTTESGLVGGLGGAGLIPAAVDPGGTEWTTVETVDPTTPGKENWRPYQDTYGQWQDQPTSPDTQPTGKYEGLWKALHRCSLKTGMMDLPWWPEYGDASTSGTVIYTTMEGITMVTSAARTGQFAFFGMGQKGGKDAHYRGIDFNGVPFYYVTTMESIPLYLNTAKDAGLTELDPLTIHTGPRFIGTTKDYLMPFCRSGKFPEVTPPFMPNGDSESRTVHLNIWNNFGCESRRRHYSLRPDTNKVIV